MFGWRDIECSIPPQAHLSNPAKPSTSPTAPCTLRRRTNGYCSLIPDHLTYFYRDGQTLFEVLSDLDQKAAEEILRHDVCWRGDGSYLRYRKKHERYLRKRFVEKGGRPRREYPIYMILGDSPSGPHSLIDGYDRKLALPLSTFVPEEVSFTYPDSLYRVPPDDLGRLYLDRDPAPRVYRLEELEMLIETYRVHKFNNHYVEAQVWVDEPLEGFRGESCEDTYGR